jgi:hypothetical protein
MKENNSETIYAHQIRIMADGRFEPALLKCCPFGRAVLFISM